MGGDPVPGPFDDLRDRFLEAEKIERRNLSRIPVKKIKWRVVYCPSCQAKVEFLPKSAWRGTLKCPNPECGIRFKVPSLNGFINNKKKEKDQRRE